MRCWSSPAASMKRKRSPWCHAASAPSRSPARELAADLHARADAGRRAPGHPPPHAATYSSSPACTAPAPARIRITPRSPCSPCSSRTSLRAGSTRRSSRSKKAASVSRRYREASRRAAPSSFDAQVRQDKSLAEARAAMLAVLDGLEGQSAHRGGGHPRPARAC